MCLPTAQAEQFFMIWRPLLNYANEQLKIVPSLSGKGSKDSIDVGHAIKVRNALWKNEWVLDQFKVLNPAHLSSENLRILEDWKYRRTGNFILYKTLKNHAIFISLDIRPEVFAVKGLNSSFEEMLGPYLPALVETVLLPFGDVIVADGLLQAYATAYGKGIREEFKQIYMDAKRGGAIIKTLLPGAPSSG